MRIFITLAILLTSTAAFAQPSVQTIDLSSSQMSEVDDGEILVEVEVDGTRIEGVVTARVNALPEDVWAVVSDFSNQDQWVPDMENATVEGSGERVVGYAETNLPFPLSRRTWSINLYNRAETVAGVDSYVSSWSYIEDSGNMNDNQGYWLIQPHPTDDGASLVRYEFIADTGIRAPDGIERNQTQRTLPGIIEGLRIRIRAIEAWNAQNQ